MTLKEVQELATAKMKEHNLNDWSFTFDNSKTRLGLCNHTHKKIQLSRYYSLYATYEQVLDTILHEIAHALTGHMHGHDNVWKKKCIEIGAKPERLASIKFFVKHKYSLSCEKCNKVIYRHRVSRKQSSACFHCCKKYNNGEFTAKYLLTIKEL